MAGSPGASQGDRYGMTGTYNKPLTKAFLKRWMKMCDDMKQRYAHTY